MCTGISAAVSPDSNISWISSGRCRVPAWKSSPHPLQASWSVDWAVPICSGLTHGTETPTSLHPSQVHISPQPETMTHPLPARLTVPLGCVEMQVILWHCWIFFNCWTPLMHVEPLQKVGCCMHKMAKTPSYWKGRKNIEWFYTCCRLRRCLFTIGNSYHYKLELANSDITPTLSPPPSSFSPFLCVKMYSEIHTDYDFSLLFCKRAVLLFSTSCCIVL